MEFSPRTKTHLQACVLRYPIRNSWCVPGPTATACTTIMQHINASVFYYCNIYLFVLRLYYGAVSVPSAENDVIECTGDKIDQLFMHILY
jgi:hypothetical protein